MLPDTYCEYKERTASTASTASTGNFFKTSVSLDSLGDRSMSLPLKVYRLIPGAVSAPMYGWSEAERLDWNLPSRCVKNFLKGGCQGAVGGKPK
jgi:hypothetical protein